MPRSQLFSPLDTADAPVSLKSQRHRRLVSLLTSAGLHTLLLLALALFVFPTMVRRTQVLKFVVGESDTYSLTTIDVTPRWDAIGSDLTDEPIVIPESEVPPELDASLFELSGAIDDPSRSSSNVSAVAYVVPKNIGESLSASNSVEGAVDRITSELEGKFEKGDLLVVWLLDASHSLVDDRKRVAVRLAPFYESIVNRHSGAKFEVRSAVVSYGSAMRERVAPTEFGKKIVSAVEDLPIDRTGDENVFSSVAKCAKVYRSSWPDRQIAIVIWTDESGDDIEHLENAIAVCREQQVSVSVVGPSSVLGADTGLHAYVDRKTQAVYQLPVRRGPETAMPERLELGYWYLTRLNSPVQGGPRSLPMWLGGQDLRGILCGFSPYAMTRLSIQTGGSYTIFDRQEERGPFDPEVMARYMPSYGSLAEYESEVQSNPLRRSIMRAVGELKGKNVDEPTTMLFIKRTGSRVFDFTRYYYTPSEFRSKLSSSRGRLKAQATRSSKFVDAALMHLTDGGDLDLGLEELYEHENSPRWRAWYDLTRGRLLATSVRLEEYRLAIDSMISPDGLAPSTNHVMLRASSELRSNETFQKRGDEAERLLRRCVRENQGTPWETLAQRELDFALGVGVRQMSLTQQPMGPASRSPSLPRF
ncbi:hypothetical protein Pla52o_22400 [Novipirellula galeiformis]|uniref:VWFA domain-containing protein n=1 Tax=Novipirellula galeiformis TaxID=2528004 RepID=A0A5C6CHD2_9BACT|nr:hypothetical protein Pla52o_22400 [Novipirellula galeiformis]